MSGPVENGGSYRVHCSGAIAKAIKQIQRRATAEGRGEQVLAAIREIWHHLVHHPAEFGEPMYRLPALRLQVRHAAVRPLLVDFAVSEDWLLVFIKGISLLAK